MKSILHSLFSSLGRRFSKAVATTSNNSLSASLTLFGKSGNDFFVYYF